MTTKIHSCKCHGNDYTVCPLIKECYRQFPGVEYHGGVGFCGPRWREAEELQRKLVAEFKVEAR